MPSGKKAKVDGVAVKPGRVTGTPNYLPQENYAIALASCEASEMKQTQPGIDLQGAAADRYEAQLKIVVEQVGWPQLNIRSSGTVWTQQCSVRARGLNAVVWDRWTVTIKPYCLNSIQPLYEEFLVSAGCMGKDWPSGTTVEDCIRYVKEGLWKATQLTKVKPVKVKVELGDEEVQLRELEGGSAPATAATAEPADDDSSPLVKEMPDDWDGGPFFMVWQHMGPLGQEDKGGGDYGRAIFSSSGSVPAEVGNGRASQRAAAGPEQVLPSAAPRPSPRAGGGGAWEECMARDSTTEEYKTAIAARGARVAELKMQLALEDDDKESEAYQEAKEELKAFLKTPPPTPAPALPVRLGSNPVTPMQA